MTTVQVNTDIAADAELLKRAEYVGSDELKTGQALCYVIDSGEVDLTQVDEPETDTLDLFAGVVHPSSDGAGENDQVTLIAEGPATVRVDGDSGEDIDIGDRLDVVDDEYNLRETTEGDGYVVALEDTTSDGEEISGLVSQTLIPIRET